MEGKTNLDAALEYLDQGWAVIPIIPGAKKPPVPWGAYVDELRLPTEEDVTKWWTKWPDANIAVVTGPLSGLVVVDCDNEEARLAAEEAGLTRTPFTVETKKGFHYYFQYPRGKEWIKNRVGSTSNGEEWPKVAGLDLRGSKGYVLAPPSKNYKWRIMPGVDLDDMPVYAEPRINKTKSDTNIVDFNDFKFEGMSLADVKAYRSIWDDTHDLVSRVGKLPEGGGNGRDDRLWKCISEGAAQGLRGDDLIANAQEFMSEFFLDEITEAKVRQMCSRVEGMEQKNHPDRLAPEKPKEHRAPTIKGITTADIARLKEEAGTTEYYVEPIIPTSGTIMQVHGYSGHGKSMFTRHMLYAAAAGDSRFGPFDLHRVPKVLYCDFENSRTNVARFMDRCVQSFGDAGDNFVIFAPFDNDHAMNLKTKEGLVELEQWINAVKPDILVIDTVRSAFPGLEENSAEEWSNINQLCLKLRNAGISVVLVHHSNKPSDGSVSGREAGSSNQLTVLETQIKVTQVFNDKATAQAKAGLYDGDLSNLPMERLRTGINDEERLEVCTELRYGKVREYTDMHEPVMYLGYVGDMETDKVRIVAERTAKQKAILFSRQWVDKDGITRTALSDYEIADMVQRPLSIVREWTMPIRAVDHGARVAEMK